MIPIADLKNISFFKTLHIETRTMFAQRAFKLERPAGVTLIIEAMAAEYCYFLISGDVRVVRMNRDGRVQVLARLTCGAPLNMISLLIHERVNRATIETLTPVSALVLTAADFEELMTEQPDFSRMLLQILAERIAKMTDLATGLSLYSVRARLAQFLIELANTNPSARGWTQDEIAANIGTVRDVVGRLLREFESKGLIKRQHQHIILLDQEGLNKAATQQDS